ncbi:MAG: hypothetical protein JWN90_693 [Parcubacteria group bacterium]|nr:hypothetical protein [Parcubacteria group bacterium]
MPFGLSVFVICLFGAATFSLGLMSGYVIPWRDLPRLSDPRKLKHGTYICLGTVQIPGRVLTGHAIDTSYSTDLICPDGQIRRYRFKVRLQAQFVVGPSGIR